MNYQARWRLAVALKQPYPNLADTGDVAATETTSAPSGGISFSANDVRIAMQNAGRAVWLALGIGAIGGAVVGGIIGYNSR